ncbi:MAG: KUP/HAK/KT family potassium transporter, partial [Geminicoccales bacterium]
MRSPGNVEGSGSRGSRTPVLVLAALGVVYGDIGTSPLYTMREAFGFAGLPLGETTVLGVLSLIFWALLVVVTLKYVAVIMRADNQGEGGVLALATLAQRGLRAGGRRQRAVIVLAMVGAALFYGDCILTPAISVLSAVEGLEVATPAFEPYVLPIAIAVLAGLFLMQRRGTAGVGMLFGPVICLWFATLATLGLLQIVANPGVLRALNPAYAFSLFAQHGWEAFVALGAVVLAVTGAEALYADMGHFGRWPIRLAWFGLVLPALLLNYFGQGALLIRDPGAVVNPFYLLAPSWALYPMVVLATWATVIASQAVISGAFSLARQAVQLGYLPRLEVRHTSEQEIGQVYLPRVNWALMAAVVIVVIGFGSSSNLAAAYGIAVLGTMMIT